MIGVNIKMVLLCLATCEECNVEANDSFHFFWKCTRARDMWPSSKLFYPNIIDQLSSFKEIMWCLMMDEKCSSESIELMLTCAWAMWGNHDDIRHGRTRKDGRMLFLWALKYLEEYRFALDLLPVAQESIHHVLRWNLPLVSSLKINVDGTIFADLRTVGIRLIVWDWNDRFVAAMCNQIHAPLGPLEVELKAIEVGL